MVTFTTRDIEILDYFNITYKEIAGLIEKLLQDFPPNTDRFYFLQAVITMIKTKNLSNEIISETAGALTAIFCEMSFWRNPDISEEKKYIT